jgi:hypothetical protein
LKTTVHYNLELPVLIAVLELFEESVLHTLSNVITVLLLIESLVEFFIVVKGFILFDDSNLPPINKHRKYIIYNPKTIM